MEHGIQAFVVPGPRFLHGLSLPQGFPYIFVGPSTSDWNSVGLLVAVDYLDCFKILEDCSSSPRRIWFRVKTKDAQGVTVCGFYAPPGGDCSFFKELLSEAAAFDLVVLIGDTNIHPRYLVVHERGCKCSHCNPSSVDKKCVALLQRAGLRCLNPVGFPTHISGTCIDHIWVSGRVLSLDVWIGEPGSVAESDPAPVLLLTSLMMRPSEQLSFARVSWVKSDEWSTAFLGIEPLLRHLARLVNCLTLCPSLLVATSGRSKLGSRRALLDVIVWLRDAWCTLVGHFAGLVSVALPKGSDPRPTIDMLDPSTSEQHMWLTFQQQWCRYLSLRVSDPNSASRLLSKLLGPFGACTFAFKDPDSGEPLTDEQTLSVIAADLRERPHKAQPAVPGNSEHVRRRVSDIRQNNANSPGPLHESWYTMEEFESFLVTVDTSKSAFRGALAALKARPLAGRDLSLAILNCGKTWGTTCTQNASRQCKPIKKSGGNIVSKVSCIRPVVQASDLASAEDGLWASRNREALVDFWGGNQFGGIYEAQAPVLVVTLLGQTRVEAQLPLVLNFADEQFGFDVAPRDDIRLGTFLAGVQGSAWLLKDDQLRMDRVRVAHKHLISDWDSPPAGIGQGRRGSVLDFNTGAKFFHDTITALSTGAAIPTTTLQYRLLYDVGSSHPVPQGPYSAKSCSQVVSSFHASERGSPQLSQLLREVATEANRAAVVDLALGDNFSIVQYVDDNVMPARSFAQSCVIRNACELYTMEHGPRFGLGPKKSAAMPNTHTYISPGHHLLYFAQEVPVVSSYRYMGVLLDQDFKFHSHLQQSLARWSEAFEKLYSSCRSKKWLFFCCNTSNGTSRKCCAARHCALYRGALSRDRP